MNQRIIFPDLQEWDAQYACVVFPAQIQGVNINCKVALSTLLRLASNSLPNNEVDIASKALALFDEYRFDIEEEIEMRIEREAFDGLGEIHLLYPSDMKVRVSERVNELNTRRIIERM